MKRMNTTTTLRFPTLTEHGYALLTEKAAHLRDQILPSLRPLLVEWDRDERVVADFERYEAELDHIEQVLAAATVIRPQSSIDGIIRLGDTVIVETLDREHTTVVIVDPEEAVLDEERVSSTSPLATSLLGARVGDTVEVSAPKGAWPCRVVSVNGVTKATVADAAAQVSKPAKAAKVAKLAKPAKAIKAAKSVTRATK